MPTHNSSSRARCQHCWRRGGTGRVLCQHTTEELRTLPTMNVAVRSSQFAVRSCASVRQLVVSRFLVNVAKRDDDVDDRRHAHDAAEHRRAHRKACSHRIDARWLRRFLGADRFVLGPLHWRARGLACVWLGSMHLMQKYTRPPARTQPTRPHTHGVTRSHIFFSTNGVSVAAAVAAAARRL